MEWEDYRIQYFDFDIAICQTEILVRAADRLLKDFPNNLPMNWQNSIREGELAYMNAMKAAIAKMPNAGIISSLDIDKQVADKYKNDPSGILRPLIEIETRMAILGHPIDDIPVAQSAYSHQLVMIFAHLDAFIANTLRAICKKQPQVLKSNKKVDWSTILDLGDWDSLFYYLVERFVYEFGWDSISKRISKFQKEMGLDIELSNSTLKVLEIGEMTRHLVIHDGARTSQELVNKLEMETGIEIGKSPGW